MQHNTYIIQHGCTQCITFTIFVSIQYLLHIYFLRTQKCFLNIRFKVKRDELKKLQFDLKVFSRY